MAVQSAEAENRRLQETITNAGVPRRYSQATLERIDRQHYPIAVGHIENFFLDFENALTNGGGMLIHGGVGTGKTYLACALVNSLLASRHTAVYATFYDVVASIKASWNGNGNEHEINRTLTIPDLLVLDEIGVQHNSDFERVIMSNVIDRRSRDCKPTILISNHRPDEVVKIVGRRAYDRLVGFGGTILEMRGTSLRINQ